MSTLESFKNITTFVLDVDGVLTDGKLLVLPNGVVARTMCIKDGYALQLAIKKGYRVIVISGGHSPEVKERLLKLGVADVFMQVTDKSGVLADYIKTHQLSSEELLCMGDDIPDLGILKMVGLATCPADAVNEVKQIAAYISHIKGGEGCVREVIEKTMKLRSDWNEDLAIRAQ